MYIWWLNQSQCEEAYDIVANSILANSGDRIRTSEILPEYLQVELCSREGRSGRGRLWIHKSLPNVGVDPWPDTELAHQFAGERGPEFDAGGIVFKEEDLDLVRQLPGIITNLKLEVI